MIEEVTVDFTTDKETMRKMRFTELEEDVTKQHVGKLYVSKPTWEAMGKPRDISITIVSRVK